LHLSIQATNFFSNVGDILYVLFLRCALIVDHAKAFVDTHFPGRHTLIKGNSVETVEKYANGHFSDIPLRDCIEMRDWRNPDPRIQC
jgi:hypothetical protein